MISISKYLKPEYVAFLDAQDRNQALNSLIELMSLQNRIQNPEEFFQAIIKRENIVSTGIGMGVAIPHAKLSLFNDFFISIGVLSKGVDWNALDHAPVRIIFMIGGPDDKQTEYLQILSALTLAIKDESRRKKILTLNSAEAIIALFEDY